MKRNDPAPLCGCAGPGKPAHETNPLFATSNNKPLHELRHLVAMLERQEAEKKTREEGEREANNA